MPSFLPTKWPTKKAMLVANMMINTPIFGPFNLTNLSS